MPNRSSAVLILAVALAGCAAPAAPVAPTPESQQALAIAALEASRVAPKPPVMATVRFEFRVPEDAARRIQYVSGGTRSISVQLGAGAPTLLDITPGQTTYAVDVAAPVGEQTFTVKTFDGLQGAGNLLATGSVTHTIVEGTANAVGVTLGGVVASLAVSVADTTPAIGPAIEKALIVEAKDATNRTIIGPYANPVTLTLSGNTTSFGLKNAVLAGSASTPTYTYTGADAATATVGATAEGLASGNVTTVTLSPRVEATAITIDQTHPALFSGGTLQLSATVTYSDNSTNQIAAWAATGSGTIGTTTGLLNANGYVGSTSIEAVAYPTDTGVVVKATRTAFAITLNTQLTTVPAEVGTDLSVGGAAILSFGMSAPTYTWTQTAGPAGTLEGGTALARTFRPTGTGAHTLQMTATAGGYSWSRDLAFTVLDHLTPSTAKVQLLGINQQQPVAATAGTSYTAATTADPTIATAAVDTANNRVLVTAVKAGSTTLTVTVADGRKATIPVTVTATTLTIQ
jgi:hypothetical protein